MTARDDAIEAGAKAMFECGMPKAVIPWERRHPDFKQAFLDEAALIHDAMAGPMRADIGRQLEEMDLDDSELSADGWFSAALKARAARTRRKVAEEIATAILAHYEGDTTALPNARRDLVLTVARYAAGKAREIGGTS